EHAQLVVYASRGTHSWLEKASDIAGLGTDSIRWVRTDRDHRLDAADLERQIAADAGSGVQPFLVIGTAGNVSTGALDPLPEIAEIAERHGLWFHVDGAYGAPAAMLEEAPAELKALARADSVALDPHKWLYNPIESACTLVRDPAALSNAFSFRPSYYRRASAAAPEHTNYYDHGFQNSRAFRALKTWLCLQQAGRNGYTRRIREDIALSQALFALADADPHLEASTQHLSIATFRYVPSNGDAADLREYADEVNLRIIERLIESGNTFVSNAELDGRQFLRACIVNFRTTEQEVRALVRDVVRAGREIEAGAAGC
ncbi:MAG TPA: aminotransferase class V-fold PLP-dependent enzyme, partial [Gammaproteobacteria bacterium]|nr:aminotransferase class V-fold PLP-dependent enzyme [Gammaproteobacteria bacterium]